MALQIPKHWVLQKKRGFGQRTLEPRITVTFRGIRFNRLAADKYVSFDNVKIFEAGTNKVGLHFTKSETDESYKVVHTKRKNKKGKSEETGERLVNCRGPLHGFKLQKGFAYQGEVVSFDQDRNEAVFELELGEGKETRRKKKE